MFLLIIIYINCIFSTKIVHSKSTRNKYTGQIHEKYRVQYTKHSTCLQYTVYTAKHKYTVHCTQYTVHSSQYTVHSTLYKAHSTQYTILNAVRNTQFTVHSTEHSTEYPFHCTQETVHNTQYKVFKYITTNPVLGATLYVTVWILPSGSSTLYCPVT